MKKKALGPGESSIKHQFIYLPRHRGLKIVDKMSCLSILNSIHERGGVQRILKDRFVITNSMKFCNILDLTLTGKLF